jgi:hypothetical protein
MMSNCDIRVDRDSAEGDRGGGGARMSGSAVGL